MRRLCKAFPIILFTDVKKYYRERENPTINTNISLLCQLTHVGMQSWGGLQTLH